MFGYTFKEDHSDLKEFVSLVTLGYSFRREFALREDKFFPITLLHSEWPKLIGVLAILSAKELKVTPLKKDLPLK